MFENPFCNLDTDTKQGTPLRPAQKNRPREQDIELLARECLWDDVLVEPRPVAMLSHFLQMQVHQTTPQRQLTPPRKQNIKDRQQIRDGLERISAGRSTAI